LIAVYLTLTYGVPVLIIQLRNKLHLVYSSADVSSGILYCETGAARYTIVLHQLSTPVLDHFYCTTISIHTIHMTDCCTQPRRIHLVAYRSISRSSSNSISSSLQSLGCLTSPSATARGRIVTHAVTHARLCTSGHHFA